MTAAASLVSSAPTSLDNSLLAVACHVGRVRAVQSHAPVQAHGRARGTSASLRVASGSGTVKGWCLQLRMADPDVASDPDEFQRIAKSAADLEPAVTTYREYQSVQGQLADAKELLKESAGGCGATTMRWWCCRVL